MKDYILTNIPSSKIPFNRMAKAEVGLGLSMGGKFGRKSLSSSEYKLDYKNGKVAIILSRGGKRRVKYIIEDDPNYLKTIQKFANDYLNRFVNENKLRRKSKSLNEGRLIKESKLEKFLKNTLTDEKKGYYWIFTNNTLKNGVLTGNINDHGMHEKSSKSEIVNALKKDKQKVDKKLTLLKNAIKEFNKKNNTSLKFKYTLNKPVIKTNRWQGDIVYETDSLVAKVTIKNESLNEANEGDRFVHKYSPEIEIELIEPTNRGWKVKQTTGRKSKTAFFDKQDIMGGKAIFKPIKESLEERLRKLIREEIQRFNEGMESGLMVYPSTPRDKAKIQKWLNSSDYYGEWAREGYFLFPEERSSYDSLEDELGREFLKHKINVRFEGV